MDQQQIARALEAGLKVLPDTTDPPNPDDARCFEWAWNELNCSAQSAVKDARELISEALAALATGRAADAP